MHIVVTYGFSLWALARRSALPCMKPEETLLVANQYNSTSSVCVSSLCANDVKVSCVRVRVAGTLRKIIEPGVVSGEVRSV